MKITSPAFENSTFIPPRYTCDGDNISPPLRFEDIPPNTKSLVLIVDDPDAPAGDFVHWTVWNIDPTVKEVEEGTIPEKGMEGPTDFSKPGWGGPCPPSGIHHYNFKLYALDISLDLPATAKKADIDTAMSGHILAETGLIGLYQRASEGPIQRPFSS